MTTGRAPEVVIVGGGPAGLAVAIEARRAGMTATVVERGRPPIDKPCGEGLMPDGVARLHQLGVVLPEEARPFHGIRYLDGDLRAEGSFPSAEGGEGPAGAGRGLGIRRTALHRAMVRRAEAVGTELLWGERVEARVAAGDRRPAPVGVRTASGRTVVGDWLVGADGLRSAVRRLAGLEASSGDVLRGRFGLRRHFALRPWTDRVEVHWSEGCEAYVTPVGPETVGIAMLWSPAASSKSAPGARGFDDLLARFPRLVERTAGAEPASEDRGCGPLARRPRAVHRGRIALVGDASGYLDAITGEGLSLAFHQAASLVGTIARCEEEGAVDLGPYARDHRRIRRLPEALIRTLLFVERRPALRRRLIVALAAEPALFDRFLGIHARTLRPRDLGLGGTLRLLRLLAVGATP